MNWIQNYKSYCKMRGLKPSLASSLKNYKIIYPMKKVIEIKSRWSGAVLFSYECEDNTISKTVTKAYLKGANLKGAYLEGANLKGANLKGANLEGANLHKTGLYQFVGFGSASRCTTYNTISNIVKCGCFYDTLESFEMQVKSKHGNSNFGKEYSSIIEVMKVLKSMYFKK
jgi:uncharacterized protein YjbI with pentapeptide repeats